MFFLVMFLLIGFLFCCFYYRNSFFYLLIIFEGVSLILFLYFSYFLSIYDFSFDSIMLFLSVMVMEGGFGLGLLIFVISRSGDDKYEGSSLLYF